MQLGPQTSSILTVAVVDGPETFAGGDAAGGAWASQPHKAAAIASAAQRLISLLYGDRPTLLLKSRAESVILNDTYAMQDPPLFHPNYAPRAEARHRLTARSVVLRRLPPF